MADEQLDEGTAAEAEAVNEEADVEESAETTKTGSEES
mgnify:FL=1